MFAISHRTTLALARSRPQLNRFFRVASTTSVHPPLIRSSLSGIKRVQRYFSVSPPPRVQYTRFSNEYTHRRRRRDWNRDAKIIIFVAATGAVYVVAQYVDTPLSCSMSLA